MKTSPLHTWKPIRRRWLNRIFALVYTIAIFALLSHHFLNLVTHRSPTLITISLFLADFVLAFQCITSQAYHLNPIRRRVFPENLSQVVASENEYPALDVFICTADPHKEPPIGVVNTALSVMAYDYPQEKLSVYLSDDGGSQLTLFAFVEAAKFARHWLPYCKKHNLVDRSPEVYFTHDPAWFPETDEIKQMYESMKDKVEKVVERGSICPDYTNEERFIHVFSKWTDGFTRQEHPTVIEVLLESSLDKDVAGCAMPTLIYVSREKNKVRPHQFKAGALNVLLRVSSTLTNAPIFLTLDCDMYSNDPQTPLRALCYFLDPHVDSKFGFVQFPQRFHGINKNDIYASEFKYETQIFTLGMDGLLGCQFMGTGCFFRRRVFSGSPSSGDVFEIQKASPEQHLENKPLHSKNILAEAHHVASCNYEINTKWGSEMGFRYGSLTEDTYTSYRLHCQGWKSVLCNPNRAAFLGDAPASLNDMLTQIKRWYMGFLSMGLCKYSPLTFGVRSMNPLQALSYAHYAFRAFWSIPIIIYGFLPQLALVNSFPIFPKVSDGWFFLYAFLFLGAYGKSILDIIAAGGTIQRWWNLQRMWLIWGISTCPFALLESSLQSLGISTFGFSLTSKVVDDEQVKRYEQGIFEFGVSSPLFLPISTAAMINLLSFAQGIIRVLHDGTSEELFVQMFIAGFVVINSLPIYEAMVFRSDKGKMPMKITIISIVVASFCYLASSFVS